MKFTKQSWAWLSLIAATVVAAGCTGALAGATFGGGAIYLAARAPILTDEERAAGCRFMGWDPRGWPIETGPLERWDYIDANGSNRNSGGLIEWRCPGSAPRRACVPPGPVKGVYDHGVLVGCKR